MQIEPQSHTRRRTLNTHVFGGRTNRNSLKNKNSRKCKFTFVCFIDIFMRMKIGNF